MLFNAEINKKAWEVRRNAAKRFCCKVKQVSWKHCIRLALDIMFQVKKIYESHGKPVLKKCLRNANKAASQIIKKSGQIKEKICNTHKKLNPKFRHPIYGIGEVTPLCEQATKKNRNKHTFFVSFNGKLTEVSRFIVREA